MQHFDASFEINAFLAYESIVQRIQNEAEQLDSIRDTADYEVNKMFQATYMHFISC